MDPIKSWVSPLGAFEIQQTQQKRKLLGNTNRCLSFFFLLSLDYSFTGGINRQKANYCLKIITLNLPTHVKISIFRALLKQTTQDPAWFVVSIVFSPFIELWHNLYIDRNIMTISPLEFSNVCLAQWWCWHAVSSVSGNISRMPRCTYSCRAAPLNGIHLFYQCL